MPANRIFTQSAQPTAADAAGLLAHSAGVQFMVVVVNDPVQRAAWQNIYRLAYERARQAIEPPRHHTRLFSVWN